MKRPLPISVFIIAQDEEARIPYTLNSIDGLFDEIIVVDSGSTDKTIEICKAFSAKVSHREWQGYGPQKLFAETLCHNDWVLNLDADEELSTELFQEIETLFQQGTPEHSAYKLPMLPLFPFQKKGNPLTANNAPIRLYNKRLATYHDGTVHDYVKVNKGSTGRLKHYVIHRTYKSLAHHVEKLNFYSDAQADNLIERGRKPTLLELLLVPFFSFLKFFIIRKGFVMGIDGIILGHMYAFHRFLRIAKVREKIVQQQRDGEK